jgi:hypothetical protein
MSKKGKKTTTDKGPKPRSPHMFAAPLQYVPEVLETEVVKKAYKDGLANPLKESGKQTSEIVKAAGSTKRGQKVFRILAGYVILR